MELSVVGCYIQRPRSWSTETSWVRAVNTAGLKDMHPASGLAMRAQAASLLIAVDSSTTSTGVVPRYASGGFGSTAANPIGTQQARPIARRFFMASPLYVRPY